MKHLVSFGILCGSEINKCLGCLWIYFICGEVCACIFMSKKTKTIYSHSVPTNITLLRSLQKGTCINKHDSSTESIKQTSILTFKQVLTVSVLLIG